MLSGHWRHPPPNLFVLPNESSLPMKRRPPTLSSPQHHHLISTLFMNDCQKPICFCEQLITIWRPQVHPGCIRIPFPVRALQHGQTTLCLPVNGYLSSSYSFSPRNCHTILSQWAHPPLSSSTTLCRSPVSLILPIFFWAFCLFSVFHELLRQCHKCLIWIWAVNCHL